MNGPQLMGIPASDLAELTGHVKAVRRRCPRPPSRGPGSALTAGGLPPPPVQDDRARLYDRCRVCFATPQTVLNDLTKGILTARSVVCLVVDECHRATKKVRRLSQTPGPVR